MTQQSLFSPTNHGERPLATLPLARTTDPQTSKDAAQAMSGSPALGNAQQLALFLVRQCPGLTANALARLAGVDDPRKINRRLRELARLDLIDDYGTHVDPETGRKGVRWWPK